MWDPSIIHVLVIINAMCFHAKKEIFLSVSSQFCEFLQLSCPDGDLKEASILDYYVAGFWWAREQGFVQEQASAFYTVLHMMLENVKGVFMCAGPYT